MRLPDAQQATIEERKLVDYLLNRAHPDNGGKAAFFQGWGFTATDPKILERAIRGMIVEAGAAMIIHSPWGTKYIVDGPLVSPNGVTPTVRTVWINDEDHAVPRLVTAYPR